VTVTLGSIRKVAPLGIAGGSHTDVQDVGSISLLPPKPKPHWQTPFTQRPACVLSVEPHSVSLTHGAEEAMATKKTRKLRVHTDITLSFIVINRG
jgi:hypothetical protein